MLNLKESQRSFLVQPSPPPPPPCLKRKLKPRDIHDSPDITQHVQLPLLTPQPALPRGGIATARGMG